MELQFYTSKEVIEMLKITRQSLNRFINTGKLKAFTLGGGNLRFSRENIEKFLKEREVK